MASKIVLLLADVLDRTICSARNTYRASSRSMKSALEPGSHGRDNAVLAACVEIFGVKAIDADHDDRVRWNMICPTM